MRLSCPHRHIRDAGATKWVIPSAWALQLGCMSAVWVGFGERPNNSVSSPVARSNSSRPSGESSRACSTTWGFLGGEDAFDAAIRSLCQANIPPRPQFNSRSDARHRSKHEDIDGKPTSARCRLPLPANRTALFGAVNFCELSLAGPDFSRGETPLFSRPKRS